jgi:hypothetical protein
MGLDLDVPDDAARYDAWGRIVTRIRDEHHDYAWGHYMFRLVRAVFTTNERLSEEGGFIFQWATLNYVDATLMLLRRELDGQNAAASLFNVLQAITAHPTVINRARYLARWGPEQPVHRQIANKTFEGLLPVRVAGQRDADHIDPARVRADLARVQSGAEHLQEYAQRTRAHRTPAAAFDTARLTFGELHEALDSVRDVIVRYCDLLGQSVPDRWEATASFNTILPFLKPWVEDRRAVKDAIGEEKRRR